MQVIYSKTNTHGNFTGLLGVLSLNFWITIFGFMFIFFFLFIVTIKYSMSRSTIALAVLDSATLIVKAFLGQGFDDDVFLKSHHGLKKTFILQLQLLSLVGAMVFWIYSGCLISFFTFSSNGPPINFVIDLKDSPMKFYLRNGTLALERLIKALNMTKLPKSIVVNSNSDIYEKILLDLANGISGIGGIGESQVWQKIINRDDLDHCVFGMHTLTEFPNYPIGWLFPKNSILKPLFDWFYMRKREHGMIQKLHDEQYNYKKDCATEPFNSVDFQTVTLLFVLLSVGVLLAIILFIAEKYFLINAFGFFGDGERESTSVMSQPVCEKCGTSKT